MRFSTRATQADINPFATSSEKWGIGSWDYGKYPVKLYNDNNVLIYQEGIGNGNSGKLPSGGVLYSSALAGSMSATVANPITFYYGSPHTVISQVGQSGDLYNYYWTSYSRGTDGKNSWSLSTPKWHNLYLDSYIPLRHKSIYDPCPYGYRIPSNGTYNQFNSNPGWTNGNYAGGLVFVIDSNSSWLLASGVRRSYLGHISVDGYYKVSTGYLNVSNTFVFSYYKNVFEKLDIVQSEGHSVRCIEECELLPDAMISKRELEGRSWSDPPQYILNLLNITKKFP